MTNFETSHAHSQALAHQAALLAEASRDALAAQARPRRGNGLAALLKVYRDARQPRPTMNAKRA